MDRRENRSSKGYSNWKKVSQYGTLISTDIIKAFQNSVAIVMCNRVGVEDKMHFSGESIAVSANEDIIAKADDKEQILYVDIYFEQSELLRSRKSYTQFRGGELYI